MARGYYTRDRDAIRRTFLAGQSTPMTGSELGQKYEFEDWVDKEALVAVVNERTVAVQTRLSVLAEEYMAMMDVACDQAVSRGPADVVPQSESKSVRREDGDVHRIRVQSGDDVLVYRLRADDPERLAQLRTDAQDLIRQRDQTIVEVLTSITGETPKRKAIVDPFHKNKK